MTEFPHLPHGVTLTESGELVVGDGVQVEALKLVYSNVSVLPSRLTVARDLELYGCLDLTALPRNLTVGGRLSLDSVELGALPEGLTVQGALSLHACTGFTTLPDGLVVTGHLDLSCCTALTALPDPLTVGSLDLAGCKSLVALPAGLVFEGDLNSCNCTSLTTLPEGLRVPAPWTCAVAQVSQPSRTVSS